MKKLIFSVMIVLTISNYSIATEKTPLKKVDIDAFTTDTQVSIPGIGDDHIALVWWIPNEFWEVIFSQDETISKTQQDELLDAMSGISMLAVVQGDITSFGAFKFYSKEVIETQMLVSFTDASGKRKKISLIQAVNPDLEILLSMFKPILGAAMGNMGNNFHFYVLNDKSNFSYRLLNPYREGYINVQLAKKNDEIMTANIELPLNSLFVPRKCPNGKNAHISWKYCPWSGIRLEE